MDGSRGTPIALKFERKIAEGESLRQANIKKDRLAAKRERLRELQNTSTLDTPVDDLSRYLKKPGPLPFTMQNERYQSDLPELDTRHFSPQPLQPEPLPTPPLSAINHGPSSRTQMEAFDTPTNAGRIAQLEANVDCERNRIQQLEENLESSRQEVKHLHKARDETRSALLHAIKRDQDEDVVRLNKRSEELEQLLERAWEKITALESEIEEGRSREQGLRRQLRAANEANSMLEDEIENLRRTRTASVSETSHYQTQSERTRRASTSRVAGSPRKKPIYEFSIPKRQGRTNIVASLVKSIPY